MKNYLVLTLIASFFIGLLSCETMDDPEMTSTSTLPMNGEYWVKYDSTSNGSAHFADRRKIIITNTANDDGEEILINDDNDGTGLVFKADVNKDELTFSASDYPITDSVIVNADTMIATLHEVSVNNGTLMEEATKTKSEEVVTDSIYMETEINTTVDTLEISIDTVSADPEVLDINVLNTIGTETWGLNLTISGYKYTGWPEDNY